MGRSRNDGLICYNPETQAIQIFRSPSISENNISDLAQDKTEIFTLVP